MKEKEMMKVWIIEKTCGTPDTCKPSDCKGCVWNEEDVKEISILKSEFDEKIHFKTKEKAEKEIL